MCVCVCVFFFSVWTLCHYFVLQLHSPAHPSVVVDGISLEGFLSNEFGDYPELGLFLVGFQEFRRSIRLFQIGLPWSGVGPVDPSLGNALQIVSLLVVSLVPQPIRRRVGIVQDDKGRVVVLAQRRLESIPGFFSAGIDHNAGIGLAALRVGGIPGIAPVGHLDGTELGDATLVLNVAVIDGLRREDTHGLPTQQTASDGTGNLFGPVNVGIRQLLAGNVTSWFVSALDREVFGYHRLAEFLVQGSSENELWIVSIIRSDDGKCLFVEFRVIRGVEEQSIEFCAAGF